MRGDDSPAGCHMAIWSTFACTQSFRLHLHHTQLYSGQCSMVTLKSHSVPIIILLRVRLTVRDTITLVS